ncbi:MAG: hypothetical protein ACI865_001591 [Flavobacteriaceae bacterium]|jgi:hypothetical protein
MKNLVLGIMIVVTSVAFAQNATTIDRKNLQDVKYHPVALKDIQVKEVVQKRPAKVKVQMFTGVVRIVNGVAIVVLDERTRNSVYAVNLPKASQVDGKLLQFSMRDSRAPMPVGVKVRKVVLLENLVVIPGK